MRLASIPSMRRCVALFAFLVIALFGSANAFAQSTIDECNCKYVTVRVSEKVGCKVTVVFLYPSHPINYGTTVAPGQEVQLECEKGTVVTVVDCQNHKNLLGPDGCLHNFPADVGCCVDACLTKDDNGCLLLDINPSEKKCLCE